jgi:urea transporter
LGSKSILAVYSQVFFTKKTLPALFFFLATFVVTPLQGFLGLLGLLLAQVTALLFMADKKLVEEGIFAFNGLLIGLAIGHYIKPAYFSLGLLTIGAPLSAFITASLFNLMGTRFDLPGMSIPFFSITWILLLVAKEVGGLHIDHEVSPPFYEKFLLDHLHPIISLFLKNIGAVFFKLNVLSGILVLIGVLLSSRIFTFLSILGFFTGTFVFVMMGGSPEILGEKVVGFNFLLSSCALGGFFLIPTSRAFLYGAIGSILASTISIGIMSLLSPFGLPPLAAPFNLSVLLLLHPLKSGFLNPEKLGLFPVSLINLKDPEESLREYIRKLKYGGENLTRITLPFFGKWKVEQGNNGKVTHYGKWKYAWDFVVTDHLGKTFRGYGLKLEDYYTYNLPVRAPAPGKVVRVIDHVPDNQPPKINLRDNWGNAVIIDHGNGEFSELSHFREGGIVVKEGDYVMRGALIGYCGNSGRSPEPHLHYNLQKKPEIGAETIKATFSNYIVTKKGADIMLSRGVPREGEYVRTPEESKIIREFLSLEPGKWWIYSSNKPGKGEEKWRVNSEEGSLYLSSHVSYKIEEDPGVIRFEGSSREQNRTFLDTFIFGLREIPLEFNDNLKWIIYEDPYPVLPFFKRLIEEYSLFFGIRKFYKLVTINRWSFDKEGLKIVSQYLLLSGEREVEELLEEEKSLIFRRECLFGRNIGLIEVRIGNRKGFSTLFSLRDTGYD